MKCVFHLVLCPFCKENGQKFRLGILVLSTEKELWSLNDQILLHSKAILQRQVQEKLILPVPKIEPLTQILSKLTEETNLLI